MMSRRERIVAGIVAQRRCGKTSLTTVLARRAIAGGARGRVRVIDPAGNLGGSFPADLDLWAETIVAENTQAIRERKTPPVSLIVWDDADGYLPKVPKRGSAWQKLYLMSAQLDVDIVYNAKRLANLPPSLLNSTTWLYVGRIPMLDVAGRDRTSVILTADEIPTRPYYYVQIDPNGDERYSLRTVLRADGSPGIEYLR